MTAILYHLQEWITAVLQPSPKFLCIWPWFKYQLWACKLTTCHHFLPSIMLSTPLLCPCPHSATHPCPCPFPLPFPSLTLSLLTANAHCSITPASWPCSACPAAAPSFWPPCCSTCPVTLVTCPIILHAASESFCLPCALPPNYFAGNLSLCHWHPIILPALLLYPTHHSACPILPIVCHVTALSFCWPIVLPALLLCCPIALLPHHSTCIVLPPCCATCTIILPATLFYLPIALQPSCSTCPVTLLPNCFATPSFFLPCCSAALLQYPPHCSTCCITLPTLLLYLPHCSATYCPIAVPTTSLCSPHCSACPVVNTNLYLRFNNIYILIIVPECPEFTVYCKLSATGDF